MRLSRHLFLLLASCGLLFPNLTLADDESSIYNNWEQFLTVGLAGLSNGTTTPTVCTFEATQDIRQGGSWTGNNGTLNNPIPGTVTIDGNGYSLYGAGYMFGGNYPKYTGDLTVRDWANWSGYIQSDTNNSPFFSIGTGAITIENSTFSDNTFSTTSKVTGGIIYAWSTASTATSATRGVTISTSHFSGNKSTVKTQGLVLNNSGTASIANSSFTNNVIGVSNSAASSSGGAAICNNGKGDMSIDHVTFSGNVASAGGAIYNAGSTSSSYATTLDISNSTFEGNEATLYSSGLGGGALYTDGYRNTITITNSSFTANKGYSGGAILDGSGGSGSYLDYYTITGSTFSGNTATSSNGGAIATQNRSYWQVENSRFEGNSATKGNGGAIWLNGSKTKAAFIDTSFIDNVAYTSTGGGAFYIQNATAVIEACAEDVLFSGNTANSGAKATAIRMYGSSATLYLNAAEGKSVTFMGDGINGNSTSSKSSLYINSANADRDTMTDGTQAAATAGIVSFKRSETTGAGATLTNLDISVEGGTLEAAGASFITSAITVCAEAQAFITESSFDASTTFTIEEAARVNISESSFYLSKGSDGVAIPAINMSADASLTLSGTITIELAGLYTSMEELVIDDNFSLQLVQIAETPLTIAEDSPLATSFALMEDETTPGLHLDNLVIALTYEGEEIAYSSVLNEEDLANNGIVSFSVSSPNIPEPATASLSLLGLSLLLRRRRR